MTAKIVLGMAIIAFTTCCGYFLSKKYRKKRLFFSQFCLFNEYFLTEISYTRRPIREFISRYRYKGEFQLFLKKYFFQRSKRPVLVSEITQESEFYFLTKEEISMIEDYFSMFGKGDSFSQKAYYSSQKEQLKKLLDNAIMEEKKYGTLWVKLGMLLGVFITILLI